MKTPFTAEQFFGVFADYNAAVWPAQIIWIALAVAVVIAARMGRGSHWIFAGVGLAWIWMAFAYHVAFFARINGAAYGFAAIFVIEAALVLWYGFADDTLLINRAPDRLSRIVGWMLVLYALIGYPLIGYAMGQRYPAMPTFGLPCPTTIFTLGIFAWALPAVPWKVLVVPVLWAIIGTSAAITMKVPEDYGLPIAALAILALAWRARSSRRVARREQSA